MQAIKFRISGIDSLLMNNPQTVDPMNYYSREKKKITSKRVKTDQDLLDLRRLDIESKTYFDDILGVYIPSTWVAASIASLSWAKAKIKKADIRSGVFPVDTKIKLHFQDDHKVKTLDDIAGNPVFHTTMLLKQGQVKIAKAAPIFHNWWFETEIEFDPAVIDRQTLLDLLSYGATYGGYGDFRPTHGRAKFEEISEISVAA